MIRIITGRNPDGIPTGWDDFPAVQIDEVTPLMGLRFDRELAALDAAGVSLGVTRWTEAEFLIRRFAGEAAEKLAELSARAKGRADDPEADERDREEFALWLARHPRFELSKRVAVWAAVNAAGRRMTLMDVLSLPSRDVLEVDDGLDFLDEPEQVDAGKA